MEFVASILLITSTLAEPLPRCDAWLKGLYGRLSYEDFSLVSRAARTLEANSNTNCLEVYRRTAECPWQPLRCIMPSTARFVGIWNWDSAFHAMAVSRWDADYAHDQIRFFTDVLEQPDGMYADCVSQAADPEERQPPALVYPVMHYRTVTVCTKPPVFAWGAWVCDRRAPFDAAFLRKVYDSLVRNERWWREHRFDAHYGLFHYDGNAADATKRKVAAGWESGMDDSPRWDHDARNFCAVDLNAYMVLTYRVLAAFAERLGEREAAAGYRAKESELAKNAEARLWDAKDGCYYDLNRTTGEFSRILTPVAFLPLFVGTASSERAAAMARQAARLSPGWPSVAYDDRNYDPVGYWRGRTWLNIAYMALKGLKYYGYAEIADAGRRTLLGWVARDSGIIYENYNSKTGEPVGAPHFGWSSAFVIAFVLDWDLGRAEERP